MTELKLYDFKEPKINSIIFKVTTQCNQSCDYCYRYEDKTSTHEVMHLDTVHRIISSYAKFIDDTKENPKNMYLIWHGGEPLLMGIKYFSEIMEIEKEFTQAGYTIFNGIQTNGLLINEEWTSFFKKNDFWVGVSIDGTKELHDAHRFYKNSESSFESVNSNLMLLTENKIPISIISVITKESLSYCKEIMEYFNKSNVISMDFIPCFLYGSKMTLDSKSYSKFMIELYDLWTASPNKKFNIRFLNDIEKKINFLKTGKGPINLGCELVGRCGENFSILPNGDIYPCECLTSLNRFKMGNINKVNLNDIHNTEKFGEFKKIVNDINSECFTCEVFDICIGGCLNRRLDECTSNNKDIYCDARKKIIKHVMENMNGI